MTSTTEQARVPAGVSTGGRFTTSARLEMQVTLTGEGVPCVRRPSTQFRHYDGPCECFFGGPQPQLPPIAGPSTL